MGYHHLIQMGLIFRTLNVSGGASIFFVCLVQIFDGIFISLQSKPAFLPNSSDCSCISNNHRSLTLTEQNVTLTFVWLDSWAMLVSLML